MHDRVAKLLADYDRAISFNKNDLIGCLRHHDWLGAIAPSELETLLDGLTQRDRPAPQSSQEALLAATLARITMGFRTAREPSRSLSSRENLRQRVVALYAHLGAESRARHELLGLLAAWRGAEDLRTLAELTASDPPAVTQAFLAPLFQRRDFDPAPLFPRLLDAMEHAPLAASVLDLANYLTREGRLPSHPAAARSETLAALLGQLTQQLDRIEENPPSPDEAETAHRRVNEGVALAVALCDTLAQIGDRAHVGKLYQALELAHRRIRTEAAYALAKLGEEPGREALVALAAEPVARLRVLAYADELGLTEKIEEHYRSPEARAEAELVAYLSDPTQMGLPPGECELIDRRTQYWPGYDDAVECFLFHFAYRLGSAVYSNVGIVGPLTLALTADLANLPPDDIYAAFAGWQAEHEDIYEMDAERFTDALAREAERFLRRLRDAGYERVEPVKLGVFFEERALVARAEREGTPGLAVIDSQDIDWRPTAQRSRPLGPNEAYWIYKGRKLLKAFNP